MENENDNLNENTEEYGENEDDDNYETINEIFYYDNVFMDSEKTNGQYIIGFYNLLYDNELKITEPVYASGISAKCFFRYKFSDVYRYLFCYRINFGTVRRSSPKIEIIKLYIKEPEGMYISLLKTFWLRIVQRTWKNQFRLRQCEILRRGHPKTLIYFQMNGKYPKTLPSIFGMLSHYSR